VSNGEYFEGDHILMYPKICKIKVLINILHELLGQATYLFLAGARLWMWTETCGKNWAWSRTVTLHDLGVNIHLKKIVTLLPGQP